jgi:hypothetical protein
VVWKNFDAERRCMKAKAEGATELPFCKSWQAENAIKVGDDEFLAFPLRRPNQHIATEAQILSALARKALQDIPERERLPEQSISGDIGVQKLRHPARWSPGKRSSGCGVLDQVTRSGEEKHHRTLAGRRGG